VCGVSERFNRRVTKLLLDLADLLDVVGARALALA
jgi:hypothetical protein